MKHLALFVIVALAACFAQNQMQTPTYEQTQKWIVSKISEGGHTLILPDGSLVSITSYEKISMDNCKLLYTEVQFTPGEGNVPAETIKSELNVPLGKVQEVRVVAVASLSIDQWAVIVKAPITGKETRTDKGVVGETTKNIDIPGGNITFGRSPNTDEDTANRMMKALSHAVDLCKKIKEPF